jgi:hypothetical protein
MAVQRARISLQAPAPAWRPTLTAPDAILTRVYDQTVVSRLLHTARHQADWHRTSRRPVGRKLGAPVDSSGRTVNPKTLMEHVC